MDLGLAGKTALITGGSRGIGAATALVMAREGANVILVARNESALAETRARIAAVAPVRIETAVCDLRSEAAIIALSQAHGDVDILVNNAGDIPSGDLFSISDEAWRSGWDSKVFAYIRMCRVYYPLMKARGGGVIVNVSGIGAVLKRPDYLCAGMGNQAMEFLTETLGAASPPDNIRIVGVSPGAVSTERNARVMRNWFGDDTVPDWPFGRRAEAEEIGNTIAFLASDRSGYTSGSIHVIDGGASISRVV